MKTEVLATKRALHATTHMTDSIRTDRRVRKPMTPLVKTRRRGVTVSSPGRPAEEQGPCTRTASPAAPRDARSCERGANACEGVHALGVAARDAPASWGLSGVQWKRPPRLPQRTANDEAGVAMSALLIPPYHNTPGAQRAARRSGGRPRSTAGRRAGACAARGGASEGGRGRALTAKKAVFIRLAKRTSRSMLRSRRWRAAHASAASCLIVSSARSYTRRRFASCGLTTPPAPGAAATAATGTTGA